MLSFPNQAQEILVEPHRLEDSYSELYVENLDNLEGLEHAGLEQSFRRAKEIMDGAKLRSLQLPSSYQGYYLIGLQRKGEWHSSGLSRVYIDPQSGLMDMSLDSSRLPGSEKLYNLSYPLHTGKVDSLAYRLFLTLVGICLLLLSCLGLVSFTKKLSGNKRSGVQP